MTNDLINPRQPPTPFNLKMTSKALEVVQSPFMTGDLQRLTAQLEHSLTPDALDRPGLRDTDVLALQARLLDALFSRTVHHAFRRGHPDENALKIALSAQKQCRQTMDALRHLRAEAAQPEKISEQTKGT